MENKLQLLKNKMLTGVKNKVFPGATYALILDGHIYIDVVGYKSLFPQKEENKVSTLYDMASLTKVIVTNVLISQLLFEKRILLDNKVSDYFNEFIHKDITIYELLTHSSGLPANIDWIDIKTKEEYMNRLFKTEKVYESGTKAIYSDIGFIILGLIIKKILGESLDVCAKKRIFDKLLMNDTSYNPTDIENCAPTEKEEDIYLKGVAHGKKTVLFNGVTGHAGVFSTIVDMSKFVMMVLNDGKCENKQIVSSEIIKLWFKPLVKDKDNFYRGLGWISGKNRMVGKYISKDTIYHTGFTGTRVLIDKGNNLGFIILSNRIHPDRKNDKLRVFRKEITDLVYELFVLNKANSEL